MRQGKKSTAKFIQLGKEWSANSALHGVKYVGEDGTHKVEKFMWVLLVSIASGFALYMCWSYWSKWDKSPILTSIESTAVPLSELSFPAFTVCNVNKVSKTRLEELLTNPRYEEIKYEDMKLALRIMTKPDLALPSKFLPDTNRLAGLMRDNNINVTELLYIMKKCQTPCDEILADCTWQDEPIDCQSIFLGRATDDGYCCSFNAKNVRVFVPEVNMTIWDAFYEQTKAALLASAAFVDYDSGLNSTNMTSDDPADIKVFVPLSENKKILDTNSAGMFAGLTVLLDSSREDYSSIMTNFDGFKVSLHGKEEFPDVSDRGFILGVDSAVNIGVEPIIIQADASINSVRFDKRLCYYEGEAKLEYFNKYTSSRCVMECITNITMTEFGCRPYFYPVPSNLTICGLDNLPNLAQKLSDIRGNQDVYCPQCYPECSEVLYKVHMSSAPFPGTAFNGSALFRRLRNTTNYSTGNFSDPDYLLAYAKENMVPIAVYYQDKVAIRYSMEVRYAWEDFVSAMGGLLGFGLGFSVIACVELFYFICFRWCFEREHRVRPGSSATLALQAVLQAQPTHRKQAPAALAQYQAQRAPLIPALPESPQLLMRRRRHAYDALADDFYVQPATNRPSVIIQHVPVPMSMPMHAFQPMFMMPAALPQAMNYNPPPSNNAPVYY